MRITIFTILYSTVVFSSLCLILAVIRTCRKDIQARRAIRSFLLDRPVTLLKIGRSHSFCGGGGSVREAFAASFSHRDYFVMLRMSDGAKKILYFDADFHPVSCSLRRIDIADVAPESRGENVLSLQQLEAMGLER
jgi:hypothetical protein